MFYIAKKKRIFTSGLNTDDVISMINKVIENGKIWSIC